LENSNQTFKEIIIDQYDDIVSKMSNTSNNKINTDKVEKKVAIDNIKAKLRSKTRDNLKEEKSLD